MRNYRKEELLLFSNLFILFITIFFVTKVLKDSIKTYEVVSASLLIDNNYTVFVNDKCLSYLNRNKYVYINSKRVKVSIVEINRKYYKNYNKLILRINMKKASKEMNITIYNEKKSFFKLFLKCWEEDK